MGKSTLFNRLIGRNDALVHKTPGLTRDRKEATFEALGVKLKVIDTAGFEMENESKESLEGRKLNKRLVEDMLLQTRNALIYADLAIFMLDVRQGISEQDLALEQWLRMKKMAIRAKDESEETLLKAIGVEQGKRKSPTRPWSASSEPTPPKQGSPPSCSRTHRIRTQSTRGLQRCCRAKCKSSETAHSRTE